MPAPDFNCVDPHMENNKPLYTDVFILVNYFHLLIAPTRSRTVKAPLNIEYPKLAGTFLIFLFSLDQYANGILCLQRLSI